MKLSESQRRWLGLIDRIGPMIAVSLRKRTREKLLELGMVEEYMPPNRIELRITERGKKYLFNWARAYGAGVVWRG